MPGQLNTVVSLQKTQTDLAEAEEQLGGIPDWMEELHQEHSERKSEIDALEAKRDEAEHTRRTAEAALADAQEKLKKYQGQISQVTTQREYTALLKEIDTVKTQIGDSEKQTFESIEAHDQAEKELVELKDAFKELDERYRGELTKWENEKPAIARRAAELKESTEELRKKLPRPILSLFDRIWERAGSQSVSPIVKLANARGSNTMWHCEACSYNVRPQVVVDLRTGDSLVQCDSCKRFLYLEEKADEASEDS